MERKEAAISPSKQIGNEGMMKVAARAVRRGQHGCQDAAGRAPSSPSGQWSTRPRLRTVNAAHTRTFSTEPCFALVAHNSSLTMPRDTHHTHGCVV